MDYPELYVNRLIQWHNGDDPPIDRILYIDPQADVIILFDIRLPDKSKTRHKAGPDEHTEDETKHTDDRDGMQKKRPNLMPRFRAVSEVEAALNAGHAHLLDPEKDPYIHLIQIKEESIPPAYRAHRDAAWAALKPLVLHENGLPRLEFFDPEERHRLIVTAAKEYTPRSEDSAVDHSEGDNADEQLSHRAADASPLRRVQPENTEKQSKKSLYDNARKWWRGGMVPNALLPYWHLSGTKDGKRKITKKLGRPGNRSISAGEPLGINIDTPKQDLLIRGYRKFFDPKQQYPWKHAYQRTCELFFNCGHEISSKGVAVPILLPVDQRPTFDQFKYYAKRALDENYVSELKRLFGVSTFNLRQRPVLGNSTQMAMGPMQIYEIDAWIADVYLVSAFNRAWIIGKPVVYTVKDVFSRLIVGFSVGLNGPSWTGAMLALINIVEDKVMFCQRYGITINPDMWPNADFCTRLLADRGEFEGYNASTLENAFGATISNVAPYRGDLKAIVERDFLMIKNETVKFIPGFKGYKIRNRGEKDYRLDACLTLYEFRQVMIRHILYHNNVWRLKQYRLDSYAIEDNVPPIPVHLWNWGIAHRTGLRREPPTAERVRLTLMPRGTASTTEHGLLFKKAYYTVAFPGDEDGKMAERLFVEARVQGRERFEVAYDSRIPETIYLVGENGRKFIPCHLLPSETSLYRRYDLDLYDVEDYWRRRENDDEEHRGVAEQEAARMHAENHALYAIAKTAAEAAQEGLTKTQRLSNIQDHRQREKEVDSREQAAHYAPAIPAPSSASPVQPTQPITDYVAPPASLDVLKSLLDEEGDEKG